MNENRRLAVAATLNTGFAAVQVVVGLAIGSVVVLADAAHQAVDALGLITAALALRLARRPATSEWSYGLGKADALGGFVSGLLLLGSVAWIVVESVRRLLAPEPVDGGGVIAIGLVAIAVNATGVLLVARRHDHPGGAHRHGADEPISIRAARLHLLTDLAGSFVVVVAGIVLTGTSWTWVDPVASLLVSVAVLWALRDVLVGAAHVLLDRAPGHASSTDLAEQLAADPEVIRVHHVHVRSLGGGRHSGSAHLVVAGDLSVHDSQVLVDRLDDAVRADLGLDHLTLQVECHPCPDRTSC
jgi:cobalt-zinc-cadmium efflux system protein